MTIIRIAALTLAFAVSGLTLAPALSAAEPEQQSVSVRYTDLDLATEQGRAELESRIDRAAEQICGINETTLGTRVPSRETRACVRDAKRALDRQFAELVREASNDG